MKSLRTVFRRLPVQLVLSHEMSLPMSMRLRYEPSDPYAVRAEFNTVGSDETVEWIIGRDLLVDGLKGPVGEGDIRVWPADEADGCALYILLMPPAGTARLKAPAQEIRTFLQETETLVPRGAEPGRIDVDALLAHFLAEGRRGMKEAQAQPLLIIARHVAPGPASPIPVSASTLGLAD